MARRRTEAWSMSFLDVISCGFGAVVLFYTIISAQSGLERIKESQELAAEARRLEQQVLNGYKYLAELRNALARVALCPTVASCAISSPWLPMARHRLSLGVVPWSRQPWG